MGDYTEHLISQAGGDGGVTLDDIEAEHNSVDGWRRGAHYHRGILLALVREQQARIERVREFHHPFTHHFMSPPAGSLEVCYSCRESYPCPTIAALTVTDES